MCGGGGVNLRGWIEGWRHTCFSRGFKLAFLGVLGRSGLAGERWFLSINHLPVSTIERSQPRSRHEQQETAGGGWVRDANLEETV